jgi:maleylacetate reductase
VIFVHDYIAPRVVFGPQSIVQLSEEIALLECKNALIITTPDQRELGEQIACLVPGKVAGVFNGAVMHVPAAVAEDASGIAKACGADSFIVVGGGSTTGLGKILALWLSLPVIAIPTTYAGSEMTPIWGITEDKLKKTGRDRKVMPRTVIYDPTLSEGLPVGISVTSSINAIAHAAEGLYAKEMNPLLAEMAKQGISAISQAIPEIVKSSRNSKARSDALYGAWLCGSVLGNVSMALHHKLCHTLGGTYNLPHAEMHTVMLPHTMAFNLPAVPAARDALKEALNCKNVPETLFDLALNNGAPVSLKELGMKYADLEVVCDLALKDQYPNPRALERSAVYKLLQDAYLGNREF